MHLISLISTRVGFLIKKILSGIRKDGGAEPQSLVSVTNICVYIYIYIVSVTNIYIGLSQERGPLSLVRTIG